MWKSDVESEKRCGKQAGSDVDYGCGKRVPYYGKTGRDVRRQWVVFFYFSKIVDGISH